MIVCLDLFRPVIATRVFGLWGGGGVFLRDVALEGGGIDEVDQHCAGVEDDTGTVEKGGVEAFDRRGTFAAGNHTEAAEFAQVDRFAVGKGFVHDFDQAVEH